MSERETILQNEYLSLQLLPEAGGRVGRLLVKKHKLEIFKPIDSTHLFDPLNWPKGGVYPLIPYSNRIADAQLNFDGKKYDLPIHPQAIPHTLHGVGHTQAWKLDECTSTKAVLSLEYDSEHWPWPIRAEQHFELVGSALSVTLAVMNKGASSMPAGLGLHPYFNAHPHMQVSFSSQRQWAISQDYLATGECTEGEVRREITPDDWAHDTCAEYLSGWGGVACVTYPEGRLRMLASEELDHLVVFAPADAPYLCLEPVSHLANGFNLLPSLGRASGTRSISPGETLTSTIKFEWSEGR